MAFLTPQRVQHMAFLTPQRGQHQRHASLVFRADFTGESFSTLLTATTEAPGPHREGYSEEKCRNVLVKHCSHVPRNYTYVDGVQLVYEILRQFLGDDNLDLAIGVLYEFIEVDYAYSWEPGANFKRWARDHAMRHVGAVYMMGNGADPGKMSLENAHIPRLRNVVVPIIKPTERLAEHRLKKREVMPQAQRVSQPQKKTLGFSLRRRNSSTEAPNKSVSPTVSNESSTDGIYHIPKRRHWEIDNAWFVSDKNNGTRIARCPSIEQYHNMGWDSGTGRGGELVGVRELTLGSPEKTSTQYPLAQHEKDKSCRNSRQLGQSFSHPVSFLRRVMVKSQEAIPRSARSHRNMQILDDSEPGESLAYVKDVPLPGDKVLTGSFYRKYNLLDRDIHLPADLYIEQKPVAEHLAVDRAFEAQMHAGKGRVAWEFKGPFTSALFVDGGLDYEWSPFD